MAVLGFHVELDALLLALQLHDLLVQLADLHALLHHFLVNFVAAVAQLLHLPFQLVELVVVGHSLLFNCF